MTVQEFPRGETRLALEEASLELRRTAGPIFSALERSGLPMIATNPRLPDNPIIFVNEAFCQVTGYLPEEALGRNCRFLQRGEKDQPGLDILRHALRSSSGCVVDIVNFRKDGTRFGNRLALDPVFDGDGKLRYFIGLQTEVTALLDLRARLVEHFAEKGFTVKPSHGS